MENDYKFTSLSLSKKLFENDSDWYGVNHYWVFCAALNKEIVVSVHDMLVGEDDNFLKRLVPAFDILNDICVKYAKDFFGYGIGKSILNRAGCRRCYPYFGYDITNKILFLIQQGNKKKAEEYIWDHCTFNKGELITNE